MLTKSNVTGLISILESAQLQVREDTVISEDGIELSRTYHRYVANPGDDVSMRPQIVKDVATLLWTPEVIAAWKAFEKSVVPPPLVKSEE